MQAFCYDAQVPAHWWVELGLFLLVDRAVSKGVSVGSCGLRMTLGIVSTDRWDCLPALLIDWPEALEPVGCWVGPVLCVKTTTSRRADASEFPLGCPPAVSLHPQ